MPRKVFLKSLAHYEPVFNLDRASQWQFTGDWQVSQ
jgi:hypothetical protein